MIPEINTCPQCDTLVLDDTVVCPNCKFVLRPEMQSASDVFMHNDDTQGVSEDGIAQHEIECSTCGEGVREGSVRCWNCGSFLQEEIESHFLQMQARPAEIITSEQAEGETVEATDFEDEEYLGDDDFDLSEGFEVYAFEMTEDQDSAEIPQLGGLAEIDPQDDDDQPIRMLDAEVGSENESAETAHQKEQAAESDTTGDEEDPLLNLALQEEMEIQKRFKKQSERMRKQTILLKCSNCKCQIRVPLYNQGKIGRCPKCMMQFIVPVVKKPKAPVQAKSEAASEAIPGHWLTGRWHQFPTAKRPKKEHALATKGEEIDIHVGPHGVLLLWPDEKPGMLKSAVKLRGEIKAKINEQLAKAPTSGQFPAKQYLHFDQSSLSELKLTAPVEPAEEAPVPLYAPGQIAMEIPHKQSEKEKDEQTTELVLPLSNYRLIVKELKSYAFDVPFHPEGRIPLDDETVTYECAFSKEAFKALKSPEFYEADPAFKLEPAGWSCQHCEAVVSEASRLEQSFGGKKPKGLSKAKCPQCEQPFGHQPLWELQVDVPDSEKLSSADDTAVAHAPTENGENADLSQTPTAEQMPVEQGSDVHS